MTPALPSASALAAIVLLLFVAPLVPGIAARIKSIVAGRRGPPVWQLYADLWKLARRGVVYSTTTTIVFRVAPVLLVTTTVGAAALLPLDGRGALLAFSGDAVAFAYLLALGRFALVLAAFDTGSSFEGMGASRDATFATLIEPGLFVALAALGVASHSFSLSAMVGAHSAITIAAAPAMALIAISVFALALAECARVPVDDPSTHLELTMIHEVMALDHSGPDLALILYANALKISVFAALLVGIAAPARNVEPWIAPAALLGGMVLMGLAIGIVESVTARMRLPRVPLFIAGGASMGLFGLILLLQ